MAKKNKHHKEYTHAICNVSVAPLRLKPSDSAEIVTQLLYGELCTVIGSRGKNWIEVRCAHDDYIGWMDNKQVEMLSEKKFNYFSENPAFALEISHMMIADQASHPLLMGSALPQFDGMSYFMPSGKYVYNGQVIMPKQIEPSPELLLKITRKYLYAPYLWGGRSPFGIDCSGLTQMVYKLLGYALPRDSAQQAEKGILVDFVESAQVGDLAFFDNSEGKIIHVGIIMEEGKIIHASGMVRIDNFDHYGIYARDRRSYTHKLRVIKRIFP